MSLKSQKEDRFLLWFVFPMALLCAIVLYIGGRDLEERKQQEQVVPRQDYRTLHPQLKTLEDSIHYFEDGM